MPKKSTVVAVYPRHTDAEAAIKELRRAGGDLKRLSNVGTDCHTEEHVVGYYNSGDRKKYWEKLSAFWGGIWSVLLWGILLAKSEGTRMRTLTRSWRAENQPQQHCTFAGSRFLLQHTTDMARSVASCNRVMTVVTREHRTILNEPANGRLPDWSPSSRVPGQCREFSRRHPIYRQTPRRPPLSSSLPVTLCDGSLLERCKVTRIGARRLAT